ncbi:hypothetical protein F4823DRAFT_637700 [Ustulina deusta]|nr:hypothetical protein F4823DRAFT_637700 [Ustulina deusta]
MNERTAQLKRDLEHEEQNYGHGSKKLCREQFLNSRHFSSPLLSSWDPPALQERREARALGFANPDYAHSPTLPSISDWFEQNPEQQSNCQSEPKLDRIICTNQPEADGLNITAHPGFQQALLPVAHSELPAVDERNESAQAQSITVKETGIPILPQIKHLSTVGPDISSSFQYNSEKSYKHQDYNGLAKTIEPLGDRPDDENGISRCADGSSIACLEPSHLETDLETESQGQSDGLQFDTCFGVIVTKPIVSQGDSNFDYPVLVDLRPSGTLFKIHYEDTGKYLGILLMPALQDLLTSYNIRVKAFISQAKSDKLLVPVKRGKPRQYEPPEYSLRIVVFGSSEDKNAVGRFLSTSDLYLQHPLRTECDLSVDYFNPHYLVRAGGEMPKIEELSLNSEVEEVKSTARVDDVAKSRILRMFDHADGVEIDLDVRPSPRLQADLMKHQLKALSFMMQKESGRLGNLPFQSLWYPDHARPGRYRHIITGAVASKPDIVGGGIIADEMGLGKTLSMLALICSCLDSLQNADAEDQNLRTTLIVTPKSTLYGWQQQIARHIHGGQVNSLVYHGSGKHRLSSQLDRVDIILTTYETLRSEHVLEGPLYSQRWLRLVLDEAHHIRNQESQVFAACCQIRAQHRWCLTGTPVQNSLDDYGSLLSFLRIHPFQDKKTVRPLDMAATCLRRTKASCELSTPLPQRYEEIEEVSLLSEDQEIYDFFKRKVQRIVIPNFQDCDAHRSERSKEANILSIITLLRVICDHVDLLPQTAIDSWKREDTKMSDQETRLLLTSSSSENMEVVEAKRSQSPQGLISEDNVMRGRLQTETSGLTDVSQHENFNGSTGNYRARSAKIFALLKKLRLQQANSKRSGHVEEALLANSFNNRRINGQSNLKSRAKAIRVFSENSNCTVMLASIGSAGEGVDFTAAQYVHILEPH